MADGREGPWAAPGAPEERIGSKARRGQAFERPPQDPDAFTLSELAALPTLAKRVERLGTISWVQFFPVAAGVKERLELLDRLSRKLLEGAECEAPEFADLLEGHEGFIEALSAKGPKVIGKG